MVNDKEEVSVISLPNIGAPEGFNFTKPELWPIWKKRFNRYMSVSGMLSKPDKDQIDLFIYIMGEKSEEILVQFKKLPITLVEALDSFDSYFRPKSNIIFERYRFNKRIQGQGESIDDFITDLHTLAENCEYGLLKEDLIRDRIVVGMLDIKVSETMQLKSTLTLKEAVDTARQVELQHKQNKIIRDKLGTSTVNKIVSSKDYDRGRSKSAGPSNPSSTQRTGGDNKQNSTSFKGKSCWFCGGPYHQRDKCVARNQNCRSCGIKGHFSKVCRSQQYSARYSHRDKIHNIKTTNIDNNNDTNPRNSLNLRESMFVGHVSSINSGAWCVNIVIVEFNEKCLRFLIDTGADCVCLPDCMVPREFLGNMSHSHTILHGPDGNALDVMGTLPLNLVYNGKRHLFDVFIIRQLEIPILGRQALQLLKIIQPPVTNSIVASVNNQCSIDVEREYPFLFNDIGEFKGEMSIKLKPNAIPFVQSVPRVVAIPLMDKLEKEINRLVSLDIIEPVEEITEWVSPIVVVPKSNEEIRLCVDYTQLNKSVKRSYFPIPKVESTLSRLKGAKYFSKIDANKGFYQIKLDRESQFLTCFICPFGRFIFKRLPFGITCAPEYFVSKFSKVLTGIKQVVFHVDDILVFSQTLEEHERVLRTVLSKLQDEGITINREKSQFCVGRIKYLGHILSDKGISIDQDRVKALLDFPPPKDKTELLRFLGMINFVAKFLDSRSQLLEPLNALLRDNNPFIWEKIQENTFLEVKKLLSSSPVLAYYDQSKKIIISADASSYGIGGCLMQEDENGNRERVAYISRTMTETERNYAQIEREALSLTWAAEKLSEYITGIKVVLETDHKPLVEILQSKNLDVLTPRLQRFRMRLMRYEYIVVYIPGKFMEIADALSRGPIPHDEPFEELAIETQAFVNFVIGSSQIRDQYLEKISKAQLEDPVCKILRLYSADGWPSRNKIPDFILPYYQYRFDISYTKDLLLKNNRIVIPAALQKEVLEYIHQGHQGIVKCRRRAQSSVWWVGLSSQIDVVVKNCPNCIEERINQKETFCAESFPTRPMEKIAADLYKCDKWFLIITDYYSRFFELFSLTSMTEDVIIEKVKEMFSRYGICSILRTDNGPQFSHRFKQFARDFNFVHITSSPHYAQSNGAVEAAVDTAKKLIKRNKDLDMSLALLNYRSTPLSSGFSPAELMMGRKFKTLLPQILEALAVPNSSDVVGKENDLKYKQIRNYNKRHRAKELSQLNSGDGVWVVDLRSYGRVVKKLNEPRSYLIETESGIYRRNRWFLIPAPYSQINKNIQTHIPPHESSPVYEAEPERVSDNSHVNENQIDDSLQEIDVPQESQVTELSSPRAQRDRRPPVWMKDYQ